VLYYPYDLMRLQGGAARFEGNACLMLRYDGTLVDGSETSLRLVSPQARDGRELAES